MDSLLNQHHGVISRAHLLAADFSPEEIRRLVAAQSLRPLRRGWYADSRAHPQVVRAVRAGGALHRRKAIGPIDPGNLTLVLKTFERPAVLTRMLRSVRRVYSGPVLVADEIR